MGRPVIGATIVLLVTLVSIHISKGETNDVEKTSQPHGIQTSSIQDSEYRVAREAKRKRNKKNQDDKNANHGRKKSGKAKQNARKNTKKIGQNKKNLIKYKNNKKKSKKQLRKTNKNKRKNEKQSRGKKKRPRKGKGKSRRTKIKSEHKKKSKQELRTNRRKSIQHKSKKTLLKLGTKQACDETVLCQKIKDYIKISNQLRKVRRITKACDTMDKKAKKSAGEFNETVAALETAIGSTSARMIYRSRWRRAIESGNDVTSIKDKLKDCSVSAKAKCQRSSVAPCQEEANLTKCETELQSWLTNFGPSKGSCLQASADCCACITALPDVSKDCLSFDQKSTIAVASKKKCTNGDEEGSFGFCKKLQFEAAEKGPKHAKDNHCGGPVGATTKGHTTTKGKCPNKWYPCNNPGGSPCRQQNVNQTGFCCQTTNSGCCAPDESACTSGSPTKPDYPCAIEDISSCVCGNGTSCAVQGCCGFGNTPTHCTCPDGSTHELGVWVRGSIRSKKEQMPLMN